MSTKIKRVSSCIRKLDKIVINGFPVNSTILVTGGPGTGKSIFAMQFLINNATKQKKGLYFVMDLGYT